MATPFESLDEALNVVPTEAEIVSVEESGELADVREAGEVDKTADRAADYEFARDNLYDIVEKMQEALTGAMEVAQDSDHPRAYEVVFNGAKHAADVVEKLQALHKKEKELSAEDPRSVSQTNVQNNVFMNGTTADLLKMLKESQDDNK